MKSIFYVVCLCFIFGCSKDDNNNSGGSTNTNGITSQDAAFVLNASLLNYTDLQLNHIAAISSADTVILGYADSMINLHTAYRQQLIDMADSLGIQTADSLDSAHVAFRAYLITLSGRQFDSVFIHNQVVDLEAVVLLHLTEISTGNNLRIKAFASVHLSEIQVQKNWADSIANFY